MNTDLISRADAEALFRTARSKLNPSDYKTADEFNTRDLMLLNAEQMIHLLPSVTPMQRTGHWIAQDIHNCHTDFKCSECGYIHSFMHLYGKPTADYTYCPNCGAKMVEPQESDHKCHTCKHYTSGENDGSCGSYICKGYSNWESEEQA